MNKQTFIKMAFTAPSLETVLPQPSPATPEEQSHPYLSAVGGAVQGGVLGHLGSNMLFSSANRDRGKAADLHVLNWHFKDHFERSLGEGRKPYLPENGINLVENMIKKLKNSALNKSKIGHYLPILATLGGAASGVGIDHLLHKDDVTKQARVNFIKKALTISQIV